MNKGDKRGIASIVAVVLSVLIAVVGVGVLWANVSSQLGQNIENVAELPDFSVVISEGYTVYDSGLSIALIQVKNGITDVNVSELQIIFFVEGNSYEFRVPSPEVNSGLPDINEARVYWFNFTKEGISGVPDYVSIAPIYSDGRIGDVISKVEMPVKKIILKENELENLKDKFISSYSGGSGGGGGDSGNPDPVLDSQCGDLVCNITFENCSICPVDCGVCNPQNFILGTTGDDIFQIYNEIVWLNGIEVNSSDNATLLGNGGNDLFVTVGDGSQMIIGNLDELDSYWIDSEDLVINLDDNEREYNFHNISGYEQPWTDDPENEDYVGLDSRGESIKDPIAEGIIFNGHGVDVFSNYTDFSSYPLFRGNPNYTDIRQGLIGDCWFLAGLAELAYKEPEVIKQLVVSIGDGNYIVRFFELEAMRTEWGAVYSHDTVGQIYYKVDADLPISVNGDLMFAGLGNRNRQEAIKAGTDGVLWVALAEKAYVDVRSTRNYYCDLTAGSTTTLFVAIANRTRHNVIYTEPFSSLNFMPETDLNNIPLWNVSFFDNNETLFGERLNQIINIDNSVIGATSSYNPDEYGWPFARGHAYAVLNNPLEDSGFYLKVYNPWGWDGNSYWDDNPNDGVSKANRTIAMAGFRKFYYH